MKRVVFSLVIIVITCLALPSCNLFQKGTEGLEYTLLDDGTYAVTGVSEENDESEIVIPSIYKGKSVSTIGFVAFKDCENIKSITIPDSVFRVWSSAFDGCSNLKYYEYENAYYLGNEANPYYFLVKLKDDVTTVKTHEQTRIIANLACCSTKTLNEVTISDGAKQIGTYAFGHCSNLTSVKISNTVEYIGNSAFSSCTSLKSIEIPNCVTEIGYSAFSNCTSLESVTIPNSITYIRGSVFSECTSLNNIVIPESVIKIEQGAFWKCTGLTNVIIKKGITTIAGFEDCTSLTSITIPDSVTTIDNGAFYGCTGLTSVEIPNSVKSIDYRAFAECTSLSSIKIPSNVTNIDWRTFEKCTSLISIEVSESNKEYKTVDGNLYTKDMTILKQYALGKTNTSFIVPNSVTSIEKGAFAGCMHLLNIEIGDRVKSIDYGVFEDCLNLTNVSIGDSVTSISVNAFAGCERLTFIVIPDKVTNIGWKAFENCKSLTIFCEATNQPSGWFNWNVSNCPVYWYREEEPTQDGNYWHYVDGEPTIWQ